MKNLLPDEDETILRDTAREFLKDAAPVAALRRIRDAGEAFDRGLWSEMVAMGWAGVLVPESAGGAAMGHASAGILAEEMGRCLAPVPFLSNAVIAATALAGRTESLGRIAAGEALYALALDEGPKFNPAAVSMTAAERGNGYRLDGRKCFVAEGSAADRLLVLANAGAGPTLFDIDASRAGITRNRHATIDSRDHAKILFEGVEATGADVVGDPGQGMAVLAPALRAGQGALAAELTGLAAGAFAMTTGYLKERKQFGMTIGAFQALRHRAAHLWCEIELTASAVLNAGRMLDADPEAADLAVSLAKARAAETAGLAVREGVQMHGGIGMTDAFDMGFYMKRARVAAEWLGDYGYHAARVARARGLAA